MSGKYIDEEVFEYALRTIMKDVIKGDQVLQEKLDKFEITTSVIKLKGVVDTLAKLHKIDNAEVGDLYLVGFKAGNYEEYIFTQENEWESLGVVKSDIDLSEYYTSIEVDSLLSKKANIESLTNLENALNDKLDVNDTLIIKCTL